MNNHRKSTPGSKRIVLLLILLIAGVSLYAEPLTAVTPETQNTALSNPLFIALLSIFVLLFVVIIVLLDVIKNVGKGIGKSEDKGGKMFSVLLVLLALYPASSKAVEVKEAVSAVNYGGLNPTLFWGMIAALMFEVVILFVVFTIIRNLIAPEHVEAAVSKSPLLAKEASFLDRMNASVTIEKEQDILMDHNYDGIRELDNDLPPWWKYGFYITIVTTFIYMIHYHITNTGDLPLAEYKNEMKAAEAEQAEVARRSKDVVNENTVTFQKDPAILASGKELFTANCAACHLPDGGGIVGPNLTDDYWLHGGRINDIFKTIKFGYPEKGMKSWKDDFSPAQIASLASYIKSLRGSHPATPKEPQGDLYKEEVLTTSSAKADSSKSQMDSTSRSPGK
jgi:cytochrome c oxidase cbb3-type subunit 3